MRAAWVVKWVMPKLWKEERMCGAAREAVQHSPTAGGLVQDAVAGEMRRREEGERTEVSCGVGKVVVREVRVKMVRRALVSMVALDFWLCYLGARCLIDG